MNDQLDVGDDVDDELTMINVRGNGGRCGRCNFGGLSTPFSYFSLPFLSLIKFKRQNAVIPVD